MATQKKTAEVDYSMQEKILALYDLQKIDSQIVFLLFRDRKSVV